MWQYNHINSNELYHYGVKGMKWGHRKKYYNSDGSLNKLGQARQNYKTANKAYDKSFRKAYNYSYRNGVFATFGKRKKKADTLWDDAYDKAAVANKTQAEYKQAKKEYRQTDEYKAKVKRNLKIGAAVAGTALAAYGAYKVAGVIKNKNNEIAIEKGREAYREIMNNKYANTILSKNSDGTATVKQYWGNGNKAETVFRSHDAAERYHIDSEVYNNKVIEEANRVMKKVSGESYGANLVNSTKNVYNYYKDKKRRR